MSSNQFPGTAIESLTAAEIEAIREMRSKATPGPVEFCVYGSKDKAWLKQELCNLVDSSPEAEFYFVGTPDDLVVAHTGNGPTSKDNALFLTVMLNEFDRLLSMLTPPPDAAVREAVERLTAYRGVSSDAPFFPHDADLDTLLRAVQSPRLTREQVRAALSLLSEMDKMLGEDIQPEDDRPAALAMQRFCAAFPEVFAGESITWTCGICGEKRPGSVKPVLDEECGDACPEHYEAGEVGHDSNN